MQIRPRSESRWLLVALFLTANAACSSTKAADASSPDTRSPPDARNLEARAPDATTLPAPVDSAGYEADLYFIAQPRPPGSAHWQKVQDLCADRLSQLGYAVQRTVAGSAINVIGRLTGQKQPERQIVLSAHYDHIPGCAGADDDASGVAGALEAARLLSLVKHDRTLVVAFWDQEETGILGSAGYAAEAKQRGDAIQMVYVFDMIGYQSQEPGSQTIPAGSELLWPEQTAAIKANQMRADFIVACFNEAPASQAAVDMLGAEAKAIGLRLYPMMLPSSLKDLPALQDLYRGDHASFWKNGYPATMINDTSVYRDTHYHCLTGPDTPDRLSSSFTTKIIGSTVGSVLRMLRAEGS